MWPKFCCNNYSYIRLQDNSPTKYLVDIRNESPTASGYITMLYVRLYLFYLLYNRTRSTEHTHTKKNRPKKQNQIIKSR